MSFVLNGAQSHGNSPFTGGTSSSLALEFAILPITHHAPKLGSDSPIVSCCANDFFFLDVCILGYMSRA